MRGLPLLKRLANFIKFSDETFGNPDRLEEKEKTYESCQNMELRNRKILKKVSAKKLRKKNLEKN